MVQAKKEAAPVESFDEAPVVTTTKKVLKKKQTVKDQKGQEWEVQGKKEYTTIKKAKKVNSDSESGSELSYD